MRAHCVIEHEPAFIAARLSATGHTGANDRKERFQFHSFRFARIERVRAAARYGRSVFAGEWISVELIERMARALSRLSQHFRGGIGTRMQAFLETRHWRRRRHGPAMQSIQVFAPRALRFVIFGGLDEHRRWRQFTRRRRCCV